MMRGRGRGRGASGPRPVARDDEGNVVEMKAEGPPPVYPEKELPPLPDSEKSAEVEPYVKTLRSINSSYLASAFHLGSVDDKQRRAVSNAALASVVTLEPSYFPRELYSEQQRNRGGSKEAQAAYWQSHSRQLQQGDDAEDLTLGRLEELAKRESMRSRALDAGGVGRTGDGVGVGGGGVLGGGEDDRDDDADAYDDDDLIGDDDDPYQQFDDDEEYEEDDDGGGDEAFF